MTLGLVFEPRVRTIPWRRSQQPTPVFMPEKSHGQRSLVGSGPGGRKESAMTERPSRCCWAVNQPAQTTDVLW